MDNPDNSQVSLGGSPTTASDSLGGEAQDAPKNAKKKQKATNKKADKAGPADGKEKKPTGAQQYVDHTYIDYAIVEEDDLRLLDENSSLLPPPTSTTEANVREKLKGMSCTYGPMKKNAGGVVQPFPGKLLEVLDRSDLVDIISWMPHGRAFIVKKPKLFTTNVLPRFFKQTKFLSFTRQLNLWGFKRITRGVDAGSYYHVLFLRGRPYLSMRMRRQKIKGTGMKLTPNPDGEPNFYSDWPQIPQLSERRVLPPLPPLPAERLGLQNGGVIDTASQNMLNALQQQQQAGGGPGQAGMQQMDKKQLGGGGSATMDRVSENMLNALKYGAAAGRGGPADNVSSFLGPNSNLSAFGNQMHQYMPPGHQNPPMPPVPPGHGQQRYPSTNPGSSYDDLLLAPGVGPLENASRLRYLEQQRSGSEGGANGGAAAGLNPNDPIHDELSAMIRSRGQQAMNAAAVGTGMYPPQQLSSDRLLMERLRDLDRAQQVKREQQDTSMLHRARLFDSNGGAPPNAVGVHPPHAAGPNNASNGMSQGGPFDRFSYPQPQLPPPPNMPSQPPIERTSRGPGPGGAAPGQDPFGNYGSDPVESSVKDALREANHLEELALAQRAKARSLALAGALQSRFGGVGEGPLSSNDSMDQQQAGAGTGTGTGKNGPSPVAGGPPSSNENAAVGDNRLSFGRPFGRKD